MDEEKKRQPRKRVPWKEKNGYKPKTGPRAPSKKQGPVVGRPKGVVDMSRLKFDDEARGRFLHHYAFFGRFTHACDAAGVAVQTVERHLDKDEDFKAAFLEAQKRYRDRVHTVAQRVALDGVKRPLLGGKDKDEIVAYETVYATNILAMELKRVDPSYRENGKEDGRQGRKSGVLVVPATQTVEEWIEENERAKPESEVA